MPDLGDMANDMGGGNDVGPPDKPNIHDDPLTSIPQSDDDMPGLEDEDEDDQQVDKMEISEPAAKVPEATGETSASATKTAAKIEEVS